MSAAWPITNVPMSDCATGPIHDRLASAERVAGSLHVVADADQTCRASTTASTARKCATARAGATQGLGFARHLRTKVEEESGVWLADAVYTLSPALSRSMRPTDPDVVAAACAEKGIPTV